MNRVCEALGIEVPFIQGPMSWLTNAEFVAAVSNAGGLGILGPNAGQREVTTDVTETGERMRREIRKVRELTDKPFAVTLVGSGVNTTSDFTAAILRVVIEERVPIVLMNTWGLPGAYGVPDDIINACRAYGVKIIVRAWQPSVADAKKCEEQGVCIYVATGFDEGGTLPAGVFSTFSIVPLIADSVNIPVCAAGGICDIRHVRAAMALGAEGVYCGSRLIPTVENPAAQNVKELIVNSTLEDLALFRTNPAWYRSLPTGLREQLIENDKNLNTPAAIEANAGLMKGTSGMRIGMLEGDLENGYVSVGTGISSIHSIQTVAEVVDELMADFR